MPVTISGTNGITNATWTTAGRPTSPSAGQSGYNTTLNCFEFYNGSYWVTIQSSTVISASIVTVGGGSGSGAGTFNVSYASGGAGGVLRASNINLTAGTTYTVVVGAGGAVASAGQSSTFTNATTATGGNATGALQTGASNADFSGGTGVGASYSGGGAGAGGNGLGGTGVGGAGGIGALSSITGTSTYYAGGGGGQGSGGNGANGLGGSGANTGSGAAGAAGSAGGSGVVILSIPTANYSGVTTGSPTVTTSGTNTIVKFTASGSYTA